MGDGSDPSEFVGREGELTRLMAAFDRARAGAGGSVIVGGVAGIGKTRLLERFGSIARADGGQVLVGGCLDFGGRGFPFAPFVDALRGFVRSVEPSRLPALLGPARRGLARLLPELGEFVPDAGSELELDRRGQARLFELVLNVIERISRSTPVVLIIEDVQWADDDTLDLLTYLLGRLRSARVLTILSVRTDDPDRDDRTLRFLAEMERDEGVARIELGSFDRRELSHLLASRAGHALPAAVLDDVMARSGGNPFYAEQLLAVLRADGAGDESRAPLPQPLRDILGARLSVLPSDALEVVRVAAAAGRRFDDEMLRAALDVPPRQLLDALRVTIDDGILVALEDADAGSSGYSFRHSLLQEVAYGQLLPAERVALHAAFAAHLQSRRNEGARTDPSELAFHLDRARQFPEAVLALIEAGEVSERARAFGQASRHYERALELWDRSGMPDVDVGVDRVAVMERAAECALLTGTHQRAIELGRGAIATLAHSDHPDPVRLGLLHDRLRWYLWDSGDHAAAQAAVADALRLIPSEPPSRARARALAQAAGLRMQAGDLREAMSLANDAISMSRVVGAPAEEALAGGVLGWCQAVSGDVDLGISTYRDALSLAERLGGPEGIALGHANLAHLLDRVGRTEASLAVAQDGFAIVRRLGVSRTYGGILLGHAAKALFDLGRWREATLIANEGLDLDPIGRSAIELHVARARIDANQGRLGEATVHLDRARELCAASDRARVYGPAILAVTAELARLDRRLDDVRAAVDAGAAHVADDRPLDPALGWLAATGLRAEADAAEVARARHDADLGAVATARVTQIAAIVERVSQAPVTAADARRAAMLALCNAEGRRLQGRGDGADWDEVAKRWEALRRPFPSAYARYRLAGAMVASGGSRADAAAVLREAHALAVALEANPLRSEIELLARHARIELEEGGLSVDMTVRPGGADPAGLGLTDREAEVIRLVAAGWSNQQIADALFITRKTASVHVSNILGKLGVHNRVEAAAMAHRLGVAGEPLPVVGVDSRA